MIFIQSWYLPMAICQVFGEYTKQNNYFTMTEPTVTWYAFDQKQVYIPLNVLLKHIKNGYYWDCITLKYSYIL